MPKLRKGRPLDRSIEQFPNDAAIHFCKMHGAVHYSFCVFCPDFTGKEQLGDRHGRKPLHCGLPAQARVGKVENGYIEMNDQEYVDLRFNRNYGVSGDPERWVSMPIDENEIKSAFNTDVPAWDWLRQSFYFCFRCGPDATGAIHFCCQCCGDRNICSNCAQNWSQVREEDRSRTVSFDCPECGERNELNLGIDDAHAGLFRDRKPDRRLRWMKERYLPVLFDWLDMQIRGDAAILARPDERRKRPSPAAVAVDLPKGWLAGHYWIDRTKRLAWREDAVADWQDHLFARVPHGLVLTDFDFDLVLSYRTADLAQAKEIRRILAERGHSVFLMEAGRNIWDSHWPLRFSQAISRARHLAVLGTPAFFEGDATTYELNEMKTQATIRAKITDVDAVVWVLSPDGQIAVDIEGSSNLRACALDALLDALGHQEEPPAEFFQPEIIRVEPIAHGPKIPLCPRCSAPVFFDERGVPWPEETINIDPKGAALALTCTNNHRYCSDCDAQQLGGNLHCCPVCYEQGLGVHPNVAGHRTPSALYYSGISTASVYKAMNPDAPACLACGAELSGDTEGLACLFGHRFCTQCADEPGQYCRQCEEETPGRVSIGAPVPKAAYFHRCKDVRTIRPEYEPGGRCDWCDEDKAAGDFVWFDSMARACSDCLDAALADLTAPRPIFGGRNWFSGAHQTKIGPVGEVHPIATCGVCLTQSESDHEMIWGPIKGYVIEAIWSICPSCLDQARRVVGRDSAQK